MALFRRKSPEDKFRAEVSAAARTLLGARVVERPEEFALELHLGGSTEPVLMYLRNVFYEVQQPGVDRAQRVRTAVLAMQRSERPSTWAEAGPRLRPALRTTSWVDVMRHNPAAKEEASRHPVAFRFSPHVWSMVVVDFEHAMSYASESDLQTWSVTAEQAHALALENLAAEDMPFDTAGSVFRLTRPDGYATSWLLRPDRLSALAHDLGPEVLALAPARDELFLLGSDDPALIPLLEEACRLQLEHPRSLSAVPYLVAPDRVEPWAPPAGHPAAQLVDRARGILELTEYAAQKARLVELYERAHEDVYVGEHSLQETDEGVVWSWASWAPDLHGLMPRVTYVAFIEDGGRPFFVPWDVVLDSAGAFLTQVDGFDPPRWRYTRWPDAEAMATLRAAAVSPG